MDHLNKIDVLALKPKFDQDLLGIGGNSSVYGVVFDPNKVIGVANKYTTEELIALKDWYDYLAENKNNPAQATIAVFLYYILKVREGKPVPPEILKDYPDLLNGV